MDRIYPHQSTGFRRKCARCRVDRHDRCVGAGDCGCTDRAHAATTDAMSNLGLQPDGMAMAGAIGDLPDDTMIGLEIAIELGVYRRLAETARLQDRPVETVMRRALEHAWGCPRGDCVHGADPMAEAAGTIVEDLEELA